MVLHICLAHIFYFKCYYWYIYFIVFTVIHYGSLYLYFIQYLYIYFSRMGYCNVTFVCNNLS